MMEVLRYALFALEVYLMGRLFWKIAVTRILNPQQYETPHTGTQAFVPQQELTVCSCERRAG